MRRFYAFLVLAGVAAMVWACAGTPSPLRGAALVCGAVLSFVALGSLLGRWLHDER